MPGCASPAVGPGHGDMRSDVGDDRCGRSRNQRRIDLIALRIEDPGAGQAVSVATLEPDLDADTAIIT